jgi:uncharacterized coiled-coil DUF342 family protein
MTESTRSADMSKSGAGIDIREDVEALETHIRSLRAQTGLPVMTPVSVERLTRILAALKEAQAEAAAQNEARVSTLERCHELDQMHSAAEAKLARAVELLNDARKVADYHGRLGVCERIDAFLRESGK